jgi:hypothetical protein
MKRWRSLCPILTPSLLLIVACAPPRAEPGNAVLSCLYFGGHVTDDLETQTLDLRDDVDELRPRQEIREERPSKEAAQVLRGLAFEGRRLAEPDDPDVGVLALEVLQPQFDLGLLPGIVRRRYAVHGPTLVHRPVLRRWRVGAYRRCVQEHGNPGFLDSTCDTRAPLDVVHPQFIQVTGGLFESGEQHDGVRVTEVRHEIVLGDVRRSPLDLPHLEAR